MSQGSEKKKHKKSRLAGVSDHEEFNTVSSGVNGHFLNGDQVKMRNQETQSEWQTIKAEALDEIAITPNYLENAETQNGEETQGTSSNSSKKKKKHKKNVEDHTDHDSTLPFVSESEVTTESSLKKKKKRQREEDSLHNNSNPRFADPPFAELPDGEDALNTKKKKKKKKHQNNDESQMESVPVEPFPAELSDGEDALNTKKKKKKKKHQNNDESQMESVPVEPFPDQTFAEEPDADDTLQLKKKKKKKKKHQSDNDNVEDSVCTEEPDVDIPRKKKKKKKRTDDQSQEGDSLLEEPVFAEEPDTDYAINSKKKKKKKKHQNDEEIQVEDPLFAEQAQTEDTANLKKKKKKKHKTADPIKEEVDITIAEQPGNDDTLQVKKKKKKKKQQIEEENQVEDPSPAEQTGTDDASPPKKKKKKKHQQEEESQLEDSTEVTVPETASTSTKKKSQKRLVEAQEATESTIEVKIEPPEQPFRPPSQNEVGAQEDSSDDGLDPLELTGRNQERRKTNVLAFLRLNEIALLEEYFPKLRSMTNSTICTIINEDLERIKEAKKKGILFQTGRFTIKENKMIKKNVREFMSLTGIDNPEKLFHTSRYPEEKAVIEQVKKNFGFKQRIAENVPRTVHEVFRRGTKIFDMSSTKGKYTDEEVEQLRKYLNIHGNKWVTIGNLVGRNSVTLQLKASQLKREVNRGNWSRKEINRLIKAVKKCILSPGEKNATENGQDPNIISKKNLYRGIPWVQVEEKVKTRNWTQCKTKWTSVLISRMNNGSNLCIGASGLDVKIHIIKWLYDSGIKDSSRVNWAELADHIGNIPPMMVQIAFYRLKKKYLPNWHIMSFKDIVQQLYTKAMPELEALLAKRKYEQQVYRKDDAFTVDEIFYKVASENRTKKKEKP
ncbi:transcription termination factor 1 [Discoglossus pictus]